MITIWNYIVFFSKTYLIQKLNKPKKSTSFQQKMRFSIKDIFSKCDQIRSFLWIWSHLLKMSLTENFIFCAVLIKSEQAFWLTVIT